MKFMSDEELMEDFLENCCITGDGLREKSGRLYKAYRAYAASVGEYARSTKVFYGALDLNGYKRHRTKKGVFVHGLRLKEAENNA